MSSPVADPAAPLQIAVRAALLAHPAMVAAFGGAPRVHDAVPPSSPAGTQVATFPYCTIGEDQIIGDTNQASDMTEIWAKVEVWSRAGDYIECKTIAAAVRAALDVYLGITGHSVVAHNFHGALYRREPDGLTRRAIVTQQYLTQPGFDKTYLTPAA